MTSRIITLDERFAGPKHEPWSVVALPPAATETAERCADFELALQEQAWAFPYIGLERESTRQRE